ncbi:phospholipid-translocating ATPase [Clonorchis sinensis]|uniref:Phospholipid-translocating ATPase n=1 Tax=Clonorchis sinensis TaxID=79923 RepID=G7YB86_CLOSI|nr:phospholipid-translocating ATPase [Clonorchis sinensis]
MRCCRKKNASPTTRTIYPSTTVHFDEQGQAFNPNAQFANNRIRTTKYSVWTFLPLNLWEQFHRLANVYFVFILILNFMPGIDAFAKEVAPIPVILTLAVIAIKDGYEDFRRHLSDRRVNRRTCKVFSLEKACYVDTRWESILPGDFVRLHTNEMIPADVLLLHSSNVAGICHIETANLDGESNLKQREILDRQCSKEAFSPLSFTFPAEVESPSSELYKFNGKLVRPDRVIPIRKNNMILRGCVLRNTDFIEGMVIYAGSETKSALNNTGPRFKRSKLEHRINLDVAWCVLILAVICFTGAVGCGIWQQNLPGDDVPFVAIDRNASTSSPAFQGFLNFWRFIIIFQSIIPLPLYVSIEFIKMHQVWHMNQDLELYDAAVDRRIEVRAFNIPEDLGQIEYVFSDKTGTLTENKMEFKRASINGIDFFMDPVDTPLEDPGTTQRSPDVGEASTSTVSPFTVPQLVLPVDVSDQQPLRALGPGHKQTSSQSLPPVVQGLTLDLPTPRPLHGKRIEGKRKKQKASRAVDVLQWRAPFSDPDESMDDFVSRSYISLDSQNSTPQAPRSKTDAVTLTDGVELRQAGSRKFTVVAHDGSVYELPMGDDIVVPATAESTACCPLSDTTLYASYESESPDELSLVKAACRQGCKLLQRGLDFVLIWLPMCSLHAGITEYTDAGNELITPHADTVIVLMWFCKLRSAHPPLVLDRMPTRSHTGGDRFRRGPPSIPGEQKGKLTVYVTYTILRIRPTFSVTIYIAKQDTLMEYSSWGSSQILLACVRRGRRDNWFGMGVVPSNKSTDCLPNFSEFMSGYQLGSPNCNSHLAELLVRKSIHPLFCVINGAVSPLLSVRTLHCCCGQADGLVGIRVLNILPFDSIRKRMSILIRHPATNDAILYTKGADSAILDRVVGSLHSGRLIRITKRVGFQKGNTLRSALVQLKDRLPASRTRDCVYKIKCSDCIKVYMGQTARELHIRIGEHNRKINKPPRNADEYRALLKDSAIAEHALDTGHKIDLENVEVLRRGLRSTSQRLMAEAVEIAKHPSVNRIEGVELARVWRTVLDQSS